MLINAQSAPNSAAASLDRVLGLRHDQPTDLGRPDELTMQCVENVISGESQQQFRSSRHPIGHADIGEGVRRHVADVDTGAHREGTGKADARKRAVPAGRIPSLHGETHTIARRVQREVG